MNRQNFHRIRFEAFKAQNPESGDFDVTFDIGGKILFAHKFMIRPISTTFDSMLSQRWTSKDVPIALDTYSYNDFYQFITFLYSEQCLLNNDNIFAMIDIAEFYQVAVFKDYCEEYMLNIECNLENVVQLYEISTKYSLDKLKKSIIPFVAANLLNLLHPDHLQLLSPELLLEIVKLDQSIVKLETLFEKVYEWTERQAMIVKESRPHLPMTEIFKEILASFIPHFDYGKMDHAFVIKFIVGKSLLPSGPELSEILTKSAKVYVQVSDGKGRIMKGSFSDLGNVYEQIQKLGGVNCSCEVNYIFWETPRGTSRPNQGKLKKKDEIEWYLVYDLANDIAVKPRSAIDGDDYLIAEMFAEDGFSMNYKCKIEVFRS